MEYLALLFFLIIAILAVTIIATVGAVASRKLNFNYTYMGVLSLLVYTGIGFITSGIDGLGAAMLLALITGFYDATAGLKLSRLCKPKLDDAKSLYETLTYEQSLAVMAFFSLFCCLIGYGIRWMIYG